MMFRQRTQVRTESKPSDPLPESLRVLANRHVDHASADRRAAQLLPSAELVRACRVIASWEGYAPTPLLSLTALAARCRVGAVHIKDEGPRFGLGSFKALGGAYAVWDAAHRARGSITVASATDGNHGRSVAWGAQRVGCRCIIYLHETVSEERERAIRAFGAEIVRTPGTYDDASRACHADAASYGWIVVSDTADEGAFGLAPLVMQGYGVLVDEAVQQLRGDWPTHIFVQAGCGGLAAAIRAHLSALRGNAPLPFFALVEPMTADCLYRSAAAGGRRSVPGDLETVMAGLAVGETSAPAWEILRTGADAFIAMADAPALEAMRVLAGPAEGDTPVVAGETGAVGLGALLALQDDARARSTLRLGADSRVLLINTEADTDPSIYRAVVGHSAAAVRSDLNQDAKETAT